MIQVFQNQGSRLMVANWPKTSQNSILASGFCTSLAILISENLWARESPVETYKKLIQIFCKTKLSQSVQNLKHRL